MQCFCSLELPNAIERRNKELIIFIGEELHIVDQLIVIAYHRDFRIIALFAILSRIHSGRTDDKGKCVVGGQGFKSSW